MHATQNNSCNSYNLSECNLILYLNKTNTNHHNWCFIMIDSLIIDFMKTTFRDACASSLSFISTSVREAHARQIGWIFKRPVPTGDKYRGWGGNTHLCLHFYLDLFVKKSPKLFIYPKSKHDLPPHNNFNLHPKSDHSPQNLEIGHKNAFMHLVINYCISLGVWRLDLTEAFTHFFASGRPNMWGLWR